MMKTPSLAASLLALTLLCFSSTTAYASKTAQDADDLLGDLRLAEAKVILDKLAGDSPKAPEIAYLRGRYAFLSGDYEGAVKHYDSALQVRKTREDWSYARKLAKDTLAVTKSYKRFTSPKGYFEVRVQPGKDEVLLPYAFEVLETAYEELGKEFGVKPPTPIRVEVYPRTSTLAKVSVLTEEEIRTSGTIALCKYNRLMITSPKALARGYGWADTLVHEYVHYIIHYEAGHGVPIWMHEGLAKYLERRWRGPGSHRLPPSTEHLLHDALRRNKLITFEQMHPSMAKLPSQEAAAVAFAEVYTVMEYLEAKAGEGAFKKLLANLKTGIDAKKAFAAVLGTTFPEFEKDWRAYLKKRPKVAFPDSAGFEEKLVFEDSKNKPTDLSQIPKPRARDHYKLGLLFQARDRHGAAAVEYRKAIRLMGNKNPIVQTRFAESLLALDKPSEAIDALSPVMKLYPSYVATWLHFGLASYQVGKYQDALKSLKEAAYINPFNPKVHDALGKVYTKLGQESHAARAKRFATMVR